MNAPFPSWLSSLLSWNQGRIRGGVHPEGHKDLTADKPIVKHPFLPERLYLPLQQHIGQPARPIVAVGDTVLKGQRVAAGKPGTLMATLHAPTSGRVVDISPYPAPHVSGLPTQTLVLEPDGQDCRGDALFPPCDDPYRLTPEEIAVRVEAAGIVGLGGAAFPSAVKLNLGRNKRIHTLIINGGECEPYLTCDDRLMRERAAEIIEGVAIMRHALGASAARVAIEDNKPEAYAAMLTEAARHERIDVVQVPSLYPMGWEKNLITHLTGQEIPAGGLTFDAGIVMHNVATAHAIREAIRQGRPLISRVVTVSGGALDNPCNLEVPLGTRLSELLAWCGHHPEQTVRYVMGGPMMGDPLPRIDVPVVKKTNGILALTADEVRATDTKPCIRCGRCVGACPVGLLPLEMMTRIRAGQLDAAVDFGLRDCISCSACSYACPSSIPLVHYFKYAQGEWAERNRNQQKNDYTKRLIEEKQQRLERARQRRSGKPAESA